MSGTSQPHDKTSLPRSTTLPSADMAPTDQAPSDKQLPNPRHYPLDIDLPFEHYEHRRIVARGILVNRIMSKFLYPGSKGLAEAYDTHRSYENGLHNFGPIKRHDTSLASDLELLRKMLTTCSITDEHFEPYHHSAHAKVLSSAGLLQAGVSHKTRRAGARDEPKVRVNLGEEIMDLVRRHYLETDDACLRLWLHTVQPPSLSSYDTLPTALRSEHTHAGTAQKSKRRDAAEIAGEGKKWYREDTQLLAAIQTQIRETRLPRLYDGGAFLPQLRLRVSSSRAARLDYLAGDTEMRQDILYFHHESYRDRIMDSVYSWPEGEAPRRVLNVPSCGSRSKRQWKQVMESSPPVDFCGMAGRGPQRNGIWSTAACGDGSAERGRSASCSIRRATSEPPHGIFTSSRLPQSFRLLKGTLIFPKMKLSTMHQRSRRRSLSRTRIAEMFDWKSRTRQEYEQDRRQTEARGGGQQSSWQTPMTHEYSTRLHALHDIVEQSVYLVETGDEKVKWAELSKMIQRVLDEADGVKSGDQPCPNCAARHLACPEPCGFCGAPSAESSCIASALSFSQFKAFDNAPGQHQNLHTATECPVAKQNRCKCGPFPQFHVAAKCAVLCSRNCGNAHPPGHFKHKNAMTCKARCCMCGIRGHSGSQCKLKRCRCGGAHLGQDCTWKVECHVEGCYNFLCGLHCSECGISRQQLEEGSEFVGRRCPACLGRAGLTNDMATQSTEARGEHAEGVPAASPTPDGNQRGRRRNPRKQRSTRPKDKAKEKEEAELPWYAPLQPRTRPIVASKSGKRNTWREPANKR